MNEKSNLRRKLEELEDEVHKSWLHDLDRVKELTQVKEILEQIINSDSIESFFDNNQSDIDYFLKNFTNKVITNILRQYYIFGENGDDHALEILKNFLRLFIKLLENYNIVIFENIKDIFDPTKSFYRGTSYGNIRVQNDKKLISKENFNESLQRKENSFLHLEEGLIIDVAIESRRNDQKFWTRGKILRVNEDNIIVFIAEENKPVLIKKGSFEYAKANSMAIDYEWRCSLKEGDLIDCYDRGKWYPSTILERKYQIINDLPKIEFRIGFRIYTHLFEDWKDYKNIWSDKKLSYDSFKKEYLGDSENLDENITFSSTRIQIFNTNLLRINGNTDSHDDDLNNYFIDDFIKFSCEGKKNFVVARNNSFSFYYSQLIIFFAEIEGFEKIISLLGNKEKISLEIVHIVMAILSQCSSLFHKEYACSLGIEIEQKIYNLINEMSQNDLRNLKKELLDIINRVLKIFLNALYNNKEEKMKILENFNINFSIKMLKSSFLEKRISAIKTLVDIIKVAKYNHLKGEFTLKLIEDNRLFNEIYGPNSHIQLINKSKEFLEIMIQNNKLSETELSIIWEATQKGDLEGKLTILNIFKEIIGSFKENHLNYIIHKLYSIPSNELTNEEINLIYEMSIHQNSNDKNQRDFNEFIIKTLFNSKFEKTEKVSNLINKMYEITKTDKTFQENVINLCMELMEKVKIDFFKQNENVILSIKILTKFIKDQTNERIVSKLLFENNNLIYKFIENFKTYQKSIKKKLNELSEIEFKNFSFDGFSHQINIKSRIDFMNLLIKEKKWTDEINLSKPIDFIYQILVENGINEDDKSEFYIWLNKSMVNSEQKSEGFNDTVFKIFNEKISKNEGFTNLSLNAFNSFLKVFLDVNSIAKNLNFNNLNHETKVKISLCTEPEKLIGFETLWRIFLESYNNEITEIGVELIYSLYSNVFCIETMTNLQTNYVLNLLNKCIDNIRSVITSSSHTKQKNMIISRSLKLLRQIIEKSEINGTGRIKSHYGLIKQKVLKININDDTSPKSKEFPIKVYGNTTIWELKEIISKKINISVDFLRFICHREEINNTDHGKTLIDLKISDGEEIKVLLNSMDNIIQQGELVINGEVVPELVQIFNDWYDTYAKTNDKMNPNDCGRFIKAVIGAREEINGDDHRIKALFRDYDKNNDDLLEREDFVSFYLECTLKPEKRRVIWDNLKQMGIRNDFKRYDDPFETHVIDKLSLPRYSLAQNEEFFDLLFSMQNFNEEICQEAFQFICTIATNPLIYRRILMIGQENSIDWTTLLNSSNIFKLIYTLQIIDSFLEGLNIDSENLESFSIEETILDLANLSLVDIREMRIEWVKYFVKSKGFSILVKIFQEKFINYISDLKNSEPSIMNKMCLQFLIKIVMIFYSSSLNKFESCQLINDSKNDGINEFSSNVLVEIFRGHLGDEIIYSLDYNLITEKIIDLLLISVFRDNKSFGYISITETSYELLISILCYAPNSIELEAMLMKEKSNDFKEITFFGILNNNPAIRNLFCLSLVKICKICNLQNRYNFLSYLLSLIFNSFNISERNSPELFETFSDLFQIYYSNSNEFEKNNVNPKECLNKLISTLIYEINNENSQKLSNQHFIGYLNVLTGIAQNIPSLKKELSEKYDLLNDILTKILFKQNNKITDNLTDEFINPEVYDDSNSNRNSNQDIRNSCYRFILVLLQNSIENFEKFFSIKLVEKIPNQDQKKYETDDKYHYGNSGRNEGFVGIKNLGCICYMNSMMQQFFMIPSLRYSFLQANDNKVPNIKNSCDIDDNILHQVQKMFSFLDFSLRQDYNPQGFCHSFKDFDGKPINTSIQQDAQEFLNRFFDKIDTSLKPTPYKYLLESVFGGKTCSQLICEKCGSVRNRYEEIYDLSLEVKNMKTLNESLEKFITPEKIDEYHCDTCKTKVTITKINSLSELPNVLICHLQRIFYNYEIDRNEKINSKLEFPKELNLKPYTTEEIMKSKNEKSNYESNEIYFKHSSYYEYHLVGVVVHMGSANSGHYYSYINTIRSGKENLLEYNHLNESNSKSWLEYNDSRISKFNVEKLQEECFGGVYGNDENDKGSSSRHGEKTKSAYMLIYERKQKFPLKIVIKEEEIKNKERIISYKKEEQFLIKKEFNILRFIDTQEYDHILEKLLTSSFYDAEKNEFYKYKSFYAVERLIPRNYYLQVADDNSIFHKQKNSKDENFISFFDSVITCFESCICELNGENEEKTTKILLIFLNFIYNILSNKNKQSLLKSTKEKFLSLLENSKKFIDLFIKIIFNYLNNNLHLLRINLLNECYSVIDIHCDILFEIIKIAFDILKPNDFTDLMRKTEEHTLARDLISVLNLIVDFFPKLPPSVILISSPILKLLKKLSELNDTIISFFVQKETIFVLITFLLGKDSPCYMETFTKPNENWDNSRPSPNKIEHLISFIHVLISSIHKSHGCLKFSERDLKCLKNSKFLKETYKADILLFSKLVTDLSYNDLEFTISSSKEILKIIEENGSYEDAELNKIIAALIPLFKVQDEYQRLRFEHIIGYPQIAMDEMNMKYNMPYFGFNKMIDKESKIYEFKSLIQNKQNCCLIKKIINLKYREKACSEIVINFLEAASENLSLLKYIRSIPSEEPKHKEFINWGLEIIQNKIMNIDSNQELKFKLEKIISEISNRVNSILNDNSILPSFFGFYDLSNFIHNQIKREKVTLIYSSDNMFIFKIEYITSFIEYKSDLDFNFSKAAMIYSNESEHKSKEYMDDTNSDLFNLKEEPNEYILIDLNLKPKNEKEFFRKILVSLTSNKSVIIQNRCQFEEEPVSSLVRFVAYNNSQKEANVSFKIKRKVFKEKTNEFIPDGTINHQISSQTIKNIFIMQKVNRHDDWTDNSLDFNYEINVQWNQYRIMQPSNNSYHNPQHLRNNNNTKYIAGQSQYYGQVYDHGQGGYNANGLSRSSNRDYNPSVYDEEEEFSEFFGKQRN